MAIRDPIDRTSAEKVDALIKASGYGYERVSVGLWNVTVPAGTNRNPIPVGIMVGSDLATLQAWGRNRSDFHESMDLFARFLKLNHQFDSLKVELTENQVLIRLDMRIRVLDGTELDYGLKQVAAVTDETIRQFKSDLK